MTRLVMFSLSYNLSPTLRDNLHKMDLLRQKILLYPISPGAELELVWEAKLDRIYWLLALEDKVLEKRTVARLLAPGSQKPKNEIESSVLSLSSAQNYLQKNWLVSTSSPTPRDSATLYRLISNLGVSINDDSLEKTLDYLKATPEHPAIPAAIAHLEALSLSSALPEKKSLAVFLSYLFLYKFGYDVRGLLVIEESLKKDLLIYEKRSQETIDGFGLTLWLEYFSGVLVWTLERVLREITTPRNPAFGGLNLNNRQKEILTLLENPQEVISNYKVQTLFKVSQVTASRDLARLAEAGLIFPRGKGRSTAYSKI